MERAVEFASQGATLRGTLSLPAPARGGRRPPVVVMAHGFSASAHGMVADRYAKVFRDGGMAVLLYDHRNFARSDGEPRREVDRWQQVLGYRDAITFVASLAEVDSDRIGIWGDSLSAGLALVVGAFDDRVRAIVGQAPACGRSLPPADPDGSIVERMAEIYASGQLVPEPPADGPMPVVSPDQSRTPSALTPVTAFRWFVAYGATEGTGWENICTIARRGPDEPIEPVLAAARVRVPTQLLIAPDDEMPGANPAVARAAFDRLDGPKKLVDLEGGHFGLLYHPGGIFDAVSAAQRDFLVRELVAT